MRRHPIKPRKYLRKGEERWRVHVPDDLWQPGDVRDFHFSAEKDAIAKAKQMVDSRGNLAGKFFRLKQDEQAEIMRLSQCAQQTRRAYSRTAVGFWQ